MRYILNSTLNDLESTCVVIEKLTSEALQEIDENEEISLEDVTVSYDCINGINVEILIDCENQEDFAKAKNHVKAYINDNFATESKFFSLIISSTC